MSRNLEIKHRSNTVGSNALRIKAHSIVDNFSLILVNERSAKFIRAKGAPSHQGTLVIGSTSLLLILLEEIEDLYFGFISPCI